MKRIITLIFVIFITSTISAQTYQAKLGTSLSSWYGSDVETNDMTILNPGILIGGGVTLGDFGDSRRTSVELLYSQKGAKYANNDVSLRYITSYLEINGMTYFLVTDQVSLGAGIYTGFLSSIKAVSVVDGDKETESADVEDWTDRPVDFGSNFGVKFHVNEQMDIDLRYGLGVLGLDEDLEAYNSTIQISFSYTP